MDQIFRRDSGSRVTSLESAVFTDDVLTLLSHWPLGDRPRSVRNEAHQARRLYRNLSRPAHFHPGGRSARGTRRKIYVRTQQPMDDRWLAAMERGALHQPFLPTECEAGRAEGRYRNRRIAPYRAEGGNNLRLRTRIFGPLPQVRELPLPSMPQKGGPSPSRRAAAPRRDRTLGIAKGFQEKDRDCVRGEGVI